ncbi:MAG: YbgC/FadM family acyl-CoA thioesterase [Myxococcota bacterium]|nr:YbgC/FadM family acyl-CoA thioesterase [Myxococcota bacterium]
MGFHIYPIQVYYEDTDHSGVVYHANYLKYFERAREHMLGIDSLVDLYRNHKIGFVVYKADLTYFKGAQFGDSLEIHSCVSAQSPYRLSFSQNAFLASSDKPLVKGTIQLACVQEHNLIKIPTMVLEAMKHSHFLEDK